MAQRNNNQQDKAAAPCPWANLAATASTLLVVVAAKALFVALVPLEEVEEQQERNQGRETDPKAM